MAPPKKINFPPIQNGLDYLKSTVEHLREQPTARDLKYAVLHLQAAVEVLLKVRLIREHWTLVFSKPNQASRAAFATGDFTSIGLDDTIVRLKGIAGVSVKAQAEHGFKRLGQVRNNLQHFGLVGQAAPGIESLAGEVLDSLLVFIKDELVPGAESEDLAALQEIQDLIAQEIGRLRSLDSARINRIEQDLDAKVQPIVACPNCERITLVLDERAECLFCDSTWDTGSLEDLAQEYAWTVLGRSWHDIAEGGEPPVQNCPECGREALADRVGIRGEPDLPMWVCFGCQLIRPPGGIEPCVRCGGLMVESGTVCSSCWNDVIHNE